MGPAWNWFATHLVGPEPQFEKLWYRSCWQWGQIAWRRNTAALQYHLGICRVSSGSFQFGGLSMLHLQAVLWGPVWCCLFSHLGMLNVSFAGSGMGGGDVLAEGNCSCQGPMRHLTEWVSIAWEPLCSRRNVVAMAVMRCILSISRLGKNIHMQDFLFPGVSLWSAWHLSVRSVSHPGHENKEAILQPQLCVTNLLSAFQEHTHVSWCWSSCLLLTSSICGCNLRRKKKTTNFKWLPLVLPTATVFLASLCSWLKRCSYCQI